MKIIILAACLALLAAPVQAQHAGHTPAMSHPAPSAAADPREPGQSAFATIQEIVALLEADPATEWSKVNIEALRQHLIDMSNVTLQARVVSEAVPGGMRFKVSGDGRVRESIRRMVSAHAATMSGTGGWRFTAAAQPEGAMLTVLVADKADEAKLRAMGFIGVMTRGMHHQAHHLMIAIGGNPHH